MNSHKLKFNVYLIKQIQCIFECKRFKHTVCRRSKLTWTDLLILHINDYIFFLFHPVYFTTVCRRSKLTWTELLILHINDYIFFLFHPVYLIKQIQCIFECKRFKFTIFFVPPCLSHHCVQEVKMDITYTQNVCTTWKHSKLLNKQKNMFIFEHFYFCLVEIYILGII